MNRVDLLKEMKESVGAKEPTVFFGKMVDVLNMLFDKVDSLEKSIQKTQVNTVMLMKWDQSVVAKMISEELAFLRSNGKQVDGTNMYQQELDALSQAYMFGQHTQDYSSFVTFWKDLLGYHPFLEARKQ